MGERPSRRGFFGLIAGAIASPVVVAVVKDDTEKKTAAQPTQITYWSTSTEPYYMEVPPSPWDTPDPLVGSS